MNRRHNILIVEDEMVISMELAATLKRLGYEISGQAISGEEAVKKADELLPDLILMDIRLQGDMDGIEAAGIIRSRHDIPVVFLTAHSDEATLKRAIEIQPSGYLIKPFRDRELYSTIELGLHKRDIRRRMKASEETRNHLQPYSLPESALLLLSQDGVITEATAAAEELLNVAPGTLINTRFDAWISRSAKDPGTVILPEAVYLKSADGREIPVIMTMGVLMEREWKGAGYVISLTRRE